MRSLLLLRPEPGLSDSVARARSLGLEVIARPLFAVRPLEWATPDPEQFDGLLLTSANAVRHGGAGLAKLRRLPVHAVGEATAEAARSAGFEVATTGSGGVDQLLAALADQRLLHPCGADRRAIDDVRVTSVPVYSAQAIADPGLPPLANLVVAVHSPRAGARLVELANDRASTVIAAISPAAAAACGGGWQRVEAAPAPSEAALLALSARLCNNPAR